MNEEFFGRLREKVLPYFEAGNGHGFDHVDRVYRLALKISEGEGADMDIVRAAVLLHDVARSKEKEVPSNEPGIRDICHAKEGAKMATGILRSVNFPEEKIKPVAHAILVHRYSDNIKAETREAEILQDADRLDALGAMVIVRMIESTLKWNCPIHDATIPVKKEYDGSKSTMINHIYEKILKITPDSFKTPKAKEIAQGRYKFIEEFIKRYIGEVEGKL
ncbi:MAG: HD domain-containing protein [Nanoarchaeota archaeon]|nr:HD domain-containing protein [Nanoarchaeota archaeon]